MSEEFKKMNPHLTQEDIDQLIYDEECAFIQQNNRELFDKLVGLNIELVVGRIMQAYADEQNTPLRERMEQMEVEMADYDELKAENERLKFLLQIAHNLVPDGHMSDDYDIEIIKTLTPPETDK